MEKIAAIVLAAGASRRMGVDKLSLPWGDGTVLDAALRPFLELDEIGEVVVVVRGGAAPAFRKGRAAVLINEGAEEGMGSSLRVGIAGASPETEVFILALGDMPALGSELVAKLLTAWRSSGKGILVPTFEGRRGHPVVLSGRYREALMASGKDMGARALIAENESDTVLCEIEDAAVVADLDTPEGYASLAAKRCSGSSPLKVLVRGAGEHASATAHRLFGAGMRVAMTEIREPTAVRRTVSFCSAVFDGTCEVEGLVGRLWKLDARAELDERVLDCVPVFVDPEGALASLWKPHVIVDARILKRNDGNSIDRAPLVIGLGPGLLAGRDVHAVIETERGHNLGRIIEDGFCARDTGVPGSIDGYTVERVLRAPCAGRVETAAEIGQAVRPGDVVCTVAGEPVVSAIPGVLRGVVHGGIEVPARLKIGDVDPRGNPAFCWTISDKARAISGSVLAAILGRFPPRWPS